MDFKISQEQQDAKNQFASFVDRWVAPYADKFDEQQEMSGELIRRMGQDGLLGSMIPEEYGGSGLDALTFGFLCEEIGRGSASLLSLITVHGMLAQALIKWGTKEQRQKWLPKMAKGEVIGAFALTEPDIGSDARNVKTNAVLEHDRWIINGKKRWISFGQVADLVLVIGQVDGKGTAFLVESDREGYSTQGITGMLGFRSAMIAELSFDNVSVPASNMVGQVGFGFSHVTGTALDQGRFSIAWGCLGLAQGAMNASLQYTSERQQFGTPLKSHQLIKEMVADNTTQIRAARLMCYNAAFLKQQRDPAFIMETSMTKYFTSRTAVKAANDAVQMHGANGCSDAYPVARYLRDAKIMEIIEGSNQMQQLLISRYGYEQLK